MIDPTVAAYLANLAANLTGGVLAALTRSAQRKLSPSPQREALVRCYRAGTALLLPEDEAARQAIQPVLDRFFEREDVQKELSVLARGRELDQEVVVELFEEEVEAADRPDYDFESRLAAFVEAFIQAADQEAALTGIIQTGQLRQANASLLDLVQDVAAIRRVVERLPAGIGNIEATGNIEADNVVGVQFNFYPAPAPSDPCAELGDRYLRALITEAIRLPLAGLEDEGADSHKTQVTLNQVYIDIDIQRKTPLSEAEKEKGAYRFADERPVKALEAAAERSNLVLLGDPGSGKSAFVNHLTYLMATARLGQQPTIAGWDGPVLWPVLITLRRMAASMAGRLELDQLPDLAPDQQAAELREAFQAYGVDWLTELGLSQEKAQTWWDCLADRPCLLIFDGLDETPEEQWPWLIQTIETIAARQEGPVIVTCRVRSYQAMPDLRGFAEDSLAPFTGDQIDAFIEKWYMAQQLPETRRAKQIADLRQAVRERDLAKMAENPLLLTTMALIHTAGVGLPGERVLLYARSVEVLMRRWQRHKHGGDSLLDRLGVQPDQMLKGLRALAYEAHQIAAPDENPDLAEEQAVGLLARLSFAGDYGRAAKFLRYVDRQAGLLVGQGGGKGQSPVYRFAHRTFQEYLAGCHLALARPEGKDLARAICSRLAEGERWYVAARLAAEHMLYKVVSEYPVLDLLYLLCPPPEPAAEREWRGVAWAGAIAAEMGAERIRQDNEPSVGRGRRFLERLLPRLETIVAEGMLTIAERGDAGDALAALDGDSRPGLGLTVRESGPLPAHQFCLVPAGPFWLGSLEGEDDLAYPDEYGHTEPVMIAYPYWMARYPVTQKQYRAFVQAAGHRIPYHEAEWARPYNWQDDVPPPHRRNHPVTLVSWRDARAYCEWLNHQLAGCLPEGYAIRLPTEAEWEKAARGGLEIPQQAGLVEAGIGELPVWSLSTAMQPNPHPKRRWPWGEWKPDSPIFQANTVESRRGGTMAVGSFPGGVSPYGCLDMAGNVWEWTRSIHKGYPYDPEDGREDLQSEGSRTLRGGSWDFKRRNARVSYRILNHPVNFSDYNGFRLVVAPV